jgi:hypothetical protein
LPPEEQKEIAPKVVGKSVRETREMVADLLKRGEEGGQR